MSELRRREDGQPPRDLAADPPAPPKIQRPARGDGDTVTVACNLSNGLTLELFEMQEMWESSPAGGRMVRKARPIPGRVVLKGNAVNIEAVLKGRASVSSENGYAFTSNVPKEFWQKWVEQNADQPYIKNHCVWAERNEVDARARAREMKGQLSGLEPIDPDNPAAKSRELRGIRRMTPNDADMEGR